MSQKERSSKESLIRIALLGGANSGKTTYLTMLLNYLDKVREQSENWQIVLDEMIQGTFSKHLNRILKEGEFPRRDGTNHNWKARIPVFGYTLSPPKKSFLKNTKVRLSFMDVPGKFYDNLSKHKNIPVKDEKGSPEDNYLNFARYLNSCHGIIILLDPKSIESLDINLLFQVRQQNWREEKHDPTLITLPHYLAFCITKVDSKVDSYDLWNTEDSINLANDLFGESLWGLKNYYRFDPKHLNNPKRNRCKFFSVSAIGRYFDNAKGYQERVHPRISSDLSEAEVMSELSENEFHRPRSQPNGWAIDDQEEPMPPSSDRIHEIESPFEPLNVFSPIEWLAYSIKACPPFTLE